jgi:uncharacterized protein (DUF302 family)
VDYTKTITLNIGYDEAVPKVKEALTARGFGTLTEIDVKATLEQKIGYQMEPYLIIGACNPALASRALEAERQIGTLLPCNVVVRKGETGVIIDAMDPAIMASVTANPQLKPIADEAARLVGEALSELGGAGDSQP